MASSADAERGGEEGDGAAISVVEWQGWDTSSPVTPTVMEVIEDIKALARDSDAPMTFGGLGGKLKANSVSFAWISRTLMPQVAIMHLIQNLCPCLILFCSAGLLWKIACVLGLLNAHYGAALSFGSICIQRSYFYYILYAMLSASVFFSFPVEIHSICFSFIQDFLRQNNTGKLLWQIFGIQSAALCLFGIREHEDIMWNAFRDSGLDLHFLQLVRNDLLKEKN
ncbi:hypothetical protein B296_00055246 [Ensete ventricosum]|uniref:Uncharacterized protein n=1 Tax=Ensete ventricosum TaxID=4639 RepID=A0A426Y0J6_ENSVE|nr:hypothetical protein B296_00055246 [Ensete ventricosum]